MEHVKFTAMKDGDKEAMTPVAKALLDFGYDIIATHGTAAYFADQGLEVKGVNKVREGRPHIVDMIKNDEISLIVNTTEGKQAIKESHSIRGAAVHRKVTYYTTLAAAQATCLALDHLDSVDVNCLQDLHSEVAA